MTDERHVRASRLLARTLRHRPAELGVELDEHGWARVGPLIRSMDGQVEFSREILEHIVATDPKGRYEFDGQHERVRARQGHSVPVDVGLERQTPPATLYHGTARRSLDAIMREGLKPMSRLYVHLSPDYGTAVNVGSRHGKPVVLEVDAATLAAEGQGFYLSRNGVWLTGPIAPRYLRTAIADPSGGREKP
ncbi:RNA 2'-phosphotransferase [Collinsella phocaeensis]|uniref:RNA 2'-phosphotransferase n=1 Tax=Collinsella phocaeensis TaxID=1871016 RepID=UPI000930CC7E|nr:RNA 2'-phosphotransferase [Collinsella phocaeensis]